jgi:glycosyltransferase involved in cell wall biosynthesis
VRILLITHGYSEPEKFKLPRALAESQDVQMIVPARIWSTALGDLRAPPSDGNVTVHANDTIPFGPHFLFRPSWRLYRRLQPDVIHIEYDPWTPEFWSAMLPLTLLYPRVPVVLFTKKNTRHIPRGPVGLIERLLTWLGMARVRTLLAASDKARSVFDRLGYAKKPTEIQAHLPFDSSVFHPEPGPVPRTAQPVTVRVGYVGSVAEHKGVGTLIAAVELVRAAGGPVVLELAGPLRDPGPTDAAAQREWVTTHGSMTNPQVSQFLRTLDVFVLASHVLPDHEEHDGQALIEAMASGVACIGSRGGIVPELVEDGVNGLLVPPGDSAALAAQITCLVEDGALRARLGAAGLRTASEHSELRVLAARRLDVYREVIGA